MYYKTEVHKQLEEELEEKLAIFPEFIRDYFTTLKSSRTKICNYGTIKQLLQYLIKSEIKKQELKDIEPEDIKKITFVSIVRYLDSLLYSQNSISTINTKKAILSGFWSYLLKIDCVTKNIIHDIPQEKYIEEDTEKTVTIPTEEQLERFLDNLKKGNSNTFDCARNIAIVKLFVGSGIRCEELIGLNVKDLHLEECPYPHIMILGKGKQKVQDKVFVSKEAVSYMLEYLTCRENFKKEKGKQVEEEAVFLCNSGKRISKAAIQNFFERYSNKEITPHMLRHLCGTRLYNQTKNLMIVQRQLRHKKIETAARYYIHVDSSDVYKAVSEL